jgi:hypothetical protein
MEKTMIDIFLPVLESGIVLAGHYAKATGRDCVSGKDMCYGLMYSARNVTGKQIGSLFPEVYEDDEEEEEEEEEEQEEETWTRYAGTDNEYALKMNECADTWNEWEPESPAEEAIKDAVNKAMQDIFPADGKDTD